MITKIQPVHGLIAKPPYEMSTRVQVIYVETIIGQSESDDLDICGQEVEKVLAYCHTESQVYTPPFGPRSKVPFEGELGSTPRWRRDLKKIEQD